MLELDRRDLIREFDLLLPRVPRPSRSLLRDPSPRESRVRRDHAPLRRRRRRRRDPASRRGREKIVLLVAVGVVSAPARRRGRLEQRPRKVFAAPREHERLRERVRAGAALPRDAAAHARARSRGRQEVVIAPAVRQLREQSGSFPGGGAAAAAPRGRVQSALRGHRPLHLARQRRHEALEARRALQVHAARARRETISVRGRRRRADRVSTRDATRRAEQPRGQVAQFLRPARGSSSEAAAAASVRARAARLPVPRLPRAVVRGGGRSRAAALRLRPAFREPGGDQHRPRQRRFQKRVRVVDPRREQRLLRGDRDPRRRVRRELEEPLEDVVVQTAADARGVRARESSRGRGGVGASVARRRRRVRRPKARLARPRGRRRRVRPRTPALERRPVLRDRVAAQAPARASPHPGTPRAGAGAGAAAFAPGVAETPFAPHPRRRRLELRGVRPREPRERDGSLASHERRRVRGARDDVARDRALCGRALAEKSIFLGVLRARRARARARSRLAAAIPRAAPRRAAARRAQLRRALPGGQIDRPRGGPALGPPMLLDVDERAQRVHRRRARVRGGMIQQRRHRFARADPERLRLQRRVAVPQLSHAQAQPADEQRRPGRRRRAGEVREAHLE